MNKNCQDLMDNIQRTLHECRDNKKTIEITEMFDISQCKNVSKWSKNIKACIDCKFGIPYISNNPFDERDPIDSNYKCKKFITKDIISGKEIIQLAKKCRNNEAMCGINAKYFIDSKDNETNEGLAERPLVA